MFPVVKVDMSNTEMLYGKEIIRKYPRYKSCSTTYNKLHVPHTHITFSVT